MHILVSVRNRWLLLIIALGSGIFCAMVDSIKQIGQIAISPRYALHALIYMAVFIILTLAGERFLTWLGAEEDRAQLRSDKQVRPFPFEGGLRTYLFLVGVILACWLPYIILTYPGVVWYDTQQQLLQWFGFKNTFTDGTFFSDQHPVLDTVIFGVFVQLGGALGSRDVGPFLYSIVQAVVTASALVSAVRYSHDIGLSRRFCTVELLFFALFPVIPLYSIGMVKDSVFLPFFIWFTIVFIEVIRTQARSLHDSKTVAVLIFLSLAVSLTKKTGFYVVVLSCVVALFSLPKKQRARLAFSMAVPLIVMVVVLPFVIFPPLHIEKGGKQEMLAIPFQQSALLVKEHAKDMSQADLNGIYAILGSDVGNRYQWWAADNVKGYTWDSAKNKSLPRYFAIWLKEGIQHPGTYLQAYLAMEEGWISMPNMFDKNPVFSLMPVYAEGNNHVFTYSSELGFSDSAGLGRSKALEQLIIWLEGSPFGMIFFSRALWSSGVAIFVVYECLRRNKRRIAWVMPYLATYAFLWVSPASVTIEGMRYVIPMVVAFPLALGGILAPDLTSVGTDSAAKNEDLTSTAKESAD